MPVCKILQKLQHCIERQRKGMKKDVIVDSYIVNEDDIEQIKVDFVRNLQLTNESVGDEGSTMQFHSFDKDNPAKQFEEEDWIYHNGKWRPPEPKISKIQQKT